MSERFVVSTITQVVDNIVHASGWSRNLVTSLIIVGSIPFFWAVGRLGWEFWLRGGLYPTLGLYKRWPGITIVLSVAAYFGVMEWASRYNLTDKYCVNTPEGIKVFDEPMVDPTYGTKATKCSREQVLWIQSSRSRIAVPHLIRIKDPLHYTFFDPRNSLPRVWYYRWPNGDIDFFDRPGFHPQMEEALRPVDRELVKELLSRAARGHDVRPQSGRAPSPPPIAANEPIAAHFLEGQTEPAVNQVETRELDGSETALRLVAEDGPFHIVLKKCLRSGEGPIECALRVENRTGAVEPILMNPLYSRGGRVSSFSDSAGAQYTAVTHGAKALSSASNMDIRPGSPLEWQIVFTKVPKVVNHGTVNLVADQGYRGRQLNFVFRDVPVGE